MSTLDFPSSPVVGDLYTFNEYTYRYDGEKWTTIRPIVVDTLRDDLANSSDPTKGAALVGNAVAQLANYATVRALPAGYVYPRIYVAGRNNLFDGAQGHFQVDVADSVSADNDGTILVDAAGRRWKRQYSGAIRLEWFASPGTDATVGLANAHDALPVYGGTIEATGLFNFSAPLTFTKRCNIVGDGASEVATNSGTVFVKLATCAGDLFTFVGPDSGCSNLTIRGVVGNTGSGVVLLSGRPKCENLSVYRCGTDGIRIGIDGSGYNQNGWRLRNVKSKNNARYGVHISDKLVANPTLPDCNGGLMDGADLQFNGSDGLYLGSAQINTFINIVSQTNGRSGIGLSQYAVGNTFIGGDSESNTGAEVLCSPGSDRNKFIGMSVYGTIDDNGANNSWLGVIGDNQRFAGLQLHNIASTESKMLDWYEEKDISSAVSVSFATPGDSVFTATRKIVTTQRIGNRIRVDFAITGGFDFTTASGALRISGLGIAASSALAGNVFTGAMNSRGIGTTRSTVCPKVNAGESQITFAGSAPGMAYEIITAANVTSGTLLQLEGHVVYTCAE